MWWQTLGKYQYEVNEKDDYTGWQRCIGGKLADGRWPEWNYKTGATRYSE